MPPTIYTRKGDTGTSTVRGKTIPKHNAIFEAMGDIDELQAAIGMFAPLIHDVEDSGPLRQIQRDLYIVSAMIAVPNCKLSLSENAVKTLEFEIDQMTCNLPELKDFILPSGPIHFARTVCRRAERHVTLVECVPDQVIAYLNRLSDYLFTFARFMDHIYENGGDMLANDHQAAKSAPPPMTYKQWRKQEQKAKKGVMKGVKEEDDDDETGAAVSTPKASVICSSAPDVMLTAPWPPADGTEVDCDSENLAIASPLGACRSMLHQTIYEAGVECESPESHTQATSEK